MGLLRRPELVENLIIKGEKIGFRVLKLIFRNVCIISILRACIMPQVFPLYNRTCTM